MCLTRLAYSCLTDLDVVVFDRCICKTIKLMKQNLTYITPAMTSHSLHWYKSVQASLIYCLYSWMPTTFTFDNPNLHSQHSPTLGGIWRSQYICPTQADRPLLACVLCTYLHNHWHNSHVWHFGKQVYLQPFWTSILINTGRHYIEVFFKIW